LADNQDIEIENILPHENYRANIPENSDVANKDNIALIQLKKEADFTSKLIGPIGYEAASDVSLMIDWRLLDEGDANMLVFFSFL
jgi:hypothetical protein